VSPLGAPIVLGDNFCRPTSGIEQQVGQLLGPDGTTPFALKLGYILPDGAGSVWHIKPYDLEPYEEIFRSYQEDERATSRFMRNTMGQVSLSSTHSHLDLYADCPGSSIFRC
jgi:hypothetical protein